MSTPLLHQGDLLRQQHKFMTRSSANYVSPNVVADPAMVILLDRKKHMNAIYQITDLVQPSILILPSCSRITMGLLLSALSWDTMTTRTTSWDEAFLTSWSESVDELASSYVASSGLTGKMAETFKDSLGHKKI
jgi:hypothetical protein